MKIKRFVAPDMRQAMQRVRDEQGPDAVILSTRRIESGIEIVAALDYDEALVREAATQLRGAEPRAEEARREAPPPAAAVARVAASSPPRRAVSDFEPADDVVKLSRKAIAAPQAPAAAVSPLMLNANRAAAPQPRPIRNQAASLHAGAPVAQAAPSPSRAKFFPADDAGVTANESQAIAALNRSAAPIAQPRAVAAVPISAPIAVEAAKPAAPTAEQPGLLGVQKELNQLRQMLEAQVSSLAWNDLGRRQPQRARVLRDLTRYGIDSDVAAEIVEKLPAELSADQSRYLPLGLLSRRLKVNAGEFIDERGVVALVGPTGVGKTTTIAKLAARFVLRRGRDRIALISTDDFRIGAEDQLLHYGRLLGVPVYTASDAKELSVLLARLADKQLVLIDTPGMSARDARLGHTVATLRGAGREIRTTLVLGANAQGAALDDIARAYAALKPAGCILTKLDEAPTLGGALSVAIRRELPLDYTADGQRVPEDLVLADAHRLVCRLAHPTAAHGVPDELDLADRFGRNAIAHA